MQDFLFMVLKISCHLFNLLMKTDTPLLFGGQLLPPNKRRSRFTPSQE